MKRGLIGIVLAYALAQGSALAQPILTVDNSFPLPGETFVQWLGDSMDPGPAGAEVTWDFTNFQPLDTASFTCLSGNVSTIVGCPLGHPYHRSCDQLAIDLTYVRITDHPWFGYPLGTLPAIHENTLVLQPPMTYEDTVLNHQSLALLNGGCNVFTYVLINEISAADGFGELILPSATLSPVLRIHAISFMADPDSILTEAYFYWSPGVHYPLAIISKKHLNGDPTGWTMRMLDPSLIVGFDENTAERTALTFTPQPVQDFLFIQGGADVGAIGRIDIFDVNGRQVVTNVNVDLRDGIDVHGLSPGLYSLSIACTGQPIRSGRFIK